VHVCHAEQKKACNNKIKLMDMIKQMGKRAYENRLIQENNTTDFRLHVSIDAV
jgi:hypothetical protein